MEFQSDESVLSACYNHDCSKIAVAFSNGKVNIYKAHDKIEKGSKIKCHQQFLSDMPSEELISAKLSWCNISDNKS